MKKAGICWLQYDGSDRDRAVWQLWRDGAAHVVSGGLEQPLPGIESVQEATVITRAKDGHQRLLAWRAAVSQVVPTDPEHDDVLSALLADRLNLRDIAQARRDWAERCTVTRLTPTGWLDEAPGQMPDTDHAAAPLPTTATTRGKLPKVLHRRQTRRPPLR